MGGGWLTEPHYRTGNEMRWHDYTEHAAPYILTDPYFSFERYDSLTNITCNSYMVSSNETKNSKTKMQFSICRACVRSIMVQTTSRILPVRMWQRFRPNLQLFIAPPKSLNAPVLFA